jgi:hypothetical protein
MMPTFLSTKFGIARSQNPNCQSGLVFTTHTHDGFESPSFRDYADTKSWLAYEQNPYSIHKIRFKKIESACV